MVDNAKLVRDLEDLRRQLRELGPSIADAFAPVIADLQETIEDTIEANYYNKTQTDSQIAAKVANPGAIAPTTVSASGAVTSLSTISGAGVSSSAGMSATGDMTATGAHRGADVYATNAPTFNITATRVAGWWESATGRGGTASSSERFKTEIEAVGLDHLRAILSIDVVHFSYIDEVRKRDDSTFEGYVGPDYHVATNIGAIAERLHEAGLWEFVVYEREPVIEQQENEDGDLVDVVVGDQLKLGADGEPIPFGIHDILIAYSLLPIVADHEKRLDAIEQHLGL
ncbi:hypothetical protein LLS1_18390 [Leifsonia sp. LS1]|uniref:tail fiber domain-containing protein n=1 Tax=Leifsonia sp. LS1 TaxID=2828483 RepID=UPI001CFF1BC1|nr:tail fiber domain-containing protein [Leifsonia sp. LS1]GIT80170.1 hypothetical protein LLS1_18390 [Leifsonia sp. LS1]